MACVTHHDACFCRHKAQLEERERLERENAELVEALLKITHIENEMVGGDWDEIELARQIARAALAKVKERT